MPIFPNMINSDFDNLAQRSIYFFLATLPGFQAVQSSDATADQQQAAYDFICSIYRQLYDDPSLLGLKVEPDDTFAESEIQSKKPKLAGNIRKPILKTEAYMHYFSRLPYTASSRATAWSAAATPPLSRKPKLSNWQPSEYRKQTTQTTGSNTPSHPG